MRGWSKGAGREEAGRWEGVGMRKIGRDGWRVKKGGERDGGGEGRRDEER